MGKAKEALERLYRKKQLSGSQVGEGSVTAF
jgi:hypothetical protein